MFRNYLKVAIRSFGKDKLYTSINLIGLAVGLASVILIFTFIRYELSYDNHYSHAGRVYRIFSEKRYKGSNENSVMLPRNLAAALRSEFPQIEAFTSFSKGTLLFSNQTDSLPFRIIYADSSFFHVFNLPLLSGNRHGPLNRNGSVVISQKAATLLFGNQNPVGQHLTHADQDGKSVSFVITAVMKDIPANTHFDGDMVIAENNAAGTLNWKMYTGSVQYILLNENANVSDLESRIPSVFRKYNFPDDIDIRFQPVRSIHLHSNIADEPFRNSDITYVYIFSFAAALILLLACINYINLTTARALKRIQEIGIRKTFGANQQQLSQQFMIESLLFFTITLPFAYLLAVLFWPTFSNTVGIPAGWSELFTSKNPVLIFSLSCVAAALAGAYPSLFLSKLRPAHALRNLQGNINLRFGIRKTLIVFQFVATIVLMISSMVVYRQLKYIDAVPLGFNKDLLMVLSYQDMHNAGQSFKNRLLQNKNVLSVSVSSWNVGERYPASSYMEDPKDSSHQLNFAFISSDFDFMPTLQTKVTEGRALSIDYASDSRNIDSINESSGHKLTADEWMNLHSNRSIVITEKTARLLNLKEPVAGQTLKMSVLQGTVVGVISDFQGLSLHEKAPMVILTAYRQIDAGYTYIRIGPNDLSSTIAYVGNVWHSFFPSTFTFNFVDEKLDRLYTSERKLVSFLSVFAVIAVAISCSGLFSLVALTIHQRTKEIGVRKVLGASVMGITTLLSKEFVRLILISFLIAMPISWYGMHVWLESFEARTELSLWLFLAAGLLAFVVTALTVGVQTLRAAGANPADSLRTQ